MPILTLRDFPVSSLNEPFWEKAEHFLLGSKWLVWSHLCFHSLSSPPSFHPYTAYLGWNWSKSGAVREKWKGWRLPYLCISLTGCCLKFLPPPIYLGCGESRTSTMISWWQFEWLAFFLQTLCSHPHQSSWAKWLIMHPARGTVPVSPKGKGTSVSLSGVSKAYPELRSKTGGISLHRHWLWNQVWEGSLHFMAAFAPKPTPFSGLSSSHCCK